MSFRDDMTRLFGRNETGEEVLLLETPDEVIVPEVFRRNDVRRAHIGSHVSSFELPRREEALLESFTLDPANPHLSTDGTCLFSQGGTRLEACLLNVREYRVPAGVREIAPHAFEFCKRLERVELPEGLATIGDQAFFACNALGRADLPDSVESLGEQAFFCTTLHRIRIPAGLRHVGEAAFVTIGRLARLHGGGDPILPSIDIDPANDRFCVEDDFLCERAEGGARALFYLANGPEMRVPDGIVRVGDYAALAVPRLRTLSLPDTLRTIGTRAFILGGPLDELRIRQSDGREIALFPGGRDGVRAYGAAFDKGEIDLERLVRDVDATTPRGKPGVARTRRTIARLRNGIGIERENRTRMMQALSDGLDDAVRSASRDEDVDCLQALADLGVLSSGNVAHAIDVAHETGGVRATSLLMDVSRRLGPSARTGLEL